MRFLPAGRRVLTAPSGLQRLIVRSIPELAYWRYPTQPHLNDLVVNEVLNCIGFARFAQEHPDFQDDIVRLGHVTIVKHRLAITLCNPIHDGCAKFHLNIHDCVLSARCGEQFSHPRAPSQGTAGNPRENVFSMIQ